MTRTELAALVHFATTDPHGFHTALINTVDTHAERVVDATRPEPDPNLEHEVPREEWMLDFLLRHENGETSCCTDGHTWKDVSTAGPDSGNMDLECTVCGEYVSNPLY